MTRKITIKEFTKELIERIDAAEDITCCTEEIKIFAQAVTQKMGDELIEINWKE